MTKVQGVVRRLRHRKFRPIGKALVAALLILTVLVVGMGVRAVFFDQAEPNTAAVQPVVEQRKKPDIATNPLTNRNFYVDTSRSVNNLVAEYQQNGNVADAQLLNRIASQPGTTWLTGPSADDPTGNRDIESVTRTSKEAATQGTVPVYQLYALPKRDACAEYSKGGFETREAYLAWIERIIGALQTDAVISIEADAVAHTINSNCLNADEIAERYALLNATALKLSQAPRVLGAYLDAGHSEWLPDPSVLVEPLRKSGIEHIRGVAVNVSFFAETGAITTWSQQLVALLGGTKGVIIDTSRNGKGTAQESGEARWCNPPGRGLGLPPTTNVADTYIDAYFWGKRAGESDGACFGWPSAGVFVPELALELARNAVQ